VEKIPVSHVQEVHMRIKGIFFSADEVPGAATDTAPVETPKPEQAAPDPAAEWKAKLAQYETQLGEVSKARTEAERAAEVARARVAQILHERDLADLVHPHAGAGMPPLELGLDLQPTEASVKARADWKTANADWALKKPATVVAPPPETPGMVPGGVEMTPEAWRTLRNGTPEQQAEFKRRSKEYDAWCEKQDKLKGVR